MPDVVITPASVVQKPNTVASVDDVVWGASVAQGMLVYPDTSGQWLPADATDVAKSGQAGLAVALTAGELGQPGKVMREGTLTLTATPPLDVGEQYLLSATVDVGALMPASDLVATNYVTLAGIAKAGDELELKPFVSGVQRA